MCYHDQIVNRHHTALIFYVCTKIWIFAFLWKTKWVIEIIRSNCLKLERSFNRKLYLNMAVKSTGSKQSSIHYAEQYLVNLDLRTIVEQKLKKNLWTPMFTFLSRRIFFLLRGWTWSKVFITLTNHLRSRLCKNIVCC